MSMTIAEHQNKGPRQGGSLFFAFTVFAVACLTLVLVPATALGISYIAGGEVTSIILFAYLSAFLTNAGFLAAIAMIIVASFAVPRAVSGLRQHRA